MKTTRQIGAGWMTQWNPIVLVGLATATGCTVLEPDSGQILPTEADRAIAPWSVEPLDVCIDGACGAEMATRIAGADLRFEDGHFRVVAELDGNLVGGELVPGWRLDISSDPLLGPTFEWQGAALHDPDWVATPTGDHLVFAVDDRSAIGLAALTDNAAVAHDQPVLTTTAVGDEIGAPSAIFFAGRSGLAFSVADRGVAIAWGTDFHALGDPELTLDATVSATAGWQEMTRITDPDCRKTSDGVLGIFFAAEGRSPSVESGGDLAEPNTSIGYAGSADGTAFLPFDANPVLDHTYSFLFHAHESEPSVAEGNGYRVMLFQEVLDGEPHLSLATHQPG